MRLSGCAIIRKAEFEIQDYMRSDSAQQNLNILLALRAAMAFLDPCRYRGTGRTWLMPFPSLDDAVIEAFAQTGCEMKLDARARRRFRELVGESEAEADEDENLLASESQARSLFSLLDDPSRHELLHLQRREFSSSGELLGYDVGYWGGDHFSLIADSFVTPRWHPPQPDTFHLLAEQLRGLNAHLLFPTPKDASSFRAWYRGQDWAETEGREDEFEIIQVCTVNLK